MRRVTEGFGMAGKARRGAEREGLVWSGTAGTEISNERKSHMGYKWKTINLKTDANVAGKVCEELRNTIGLTKENLVEVSRPKNAPLHNEFEWNDSKAAEEWRKEQAGYIIRHLTIETETMTATPVRAFFQVEGGCSRAYEHINAIMVDESKKNRLLDIAIRELESFKAKYNMLKELEKVFEAIDQVTERENGEAN